jgi:hypothetical protein
MVPGRAPTNTRRRATNLSKPAKPQMENCKTNQLLAALRCKPALTPKHLR